MSDMSLNQAKEIIEKIELAELTLNRTYQNIQKASKEFEQSLKLQQQLLSQMPRINIKLNFLRFVVALNVGFILGLVICKIFF